MSPYQAKLAVPFGVLGLRTTRACLQQIDFLPRSHGELAPCDAVAERACAQIRRYLADPEYRCEIPLGTRGTAFQRRVWARIGAIAPGRTRTYAGLAAELDSAARAVGQACGANPVPLVIPCHRVVSSSGLGGFAHASGGFPLSIKRWLLEHEGALP